MAVRTHSAPTELRLARRYLMAVMLSTPLLFALAGFAMRQNALPIWPQPLVEPVPRGQIRLPVSW